ncbi:hypothetical protein GCK72_001762 [Caenorhabditis remanei]|uniref:PAN-3 domain-containing protein n=1 Tax=Caenorhabditis remanei TaxID=31234 RepID=A0A6A5HQL7_CAERE|nr:hypothetical protein GCK72_001762 [Caenorhabditis remanei]KAF1769945.1 hypothetical protein GCK72_001762 [Caenorhabditis remanei]
MVVIHGEPLTFTNYSTSSLNWNSCMSYCYQMLTCIAVHYYDQNPECQIFEIGKIHDLKQLDAYSGKIMAVKMLSNPTQCSSTSDGNSMRGEVSTSSMYQNYSITANLDIWSISASPLYKCPDSFRLFHRVLGMWCIGVVVTGPITQQDGSQLCIQDYLGVLSGFDSRDELRYMIDTVVLLVPSNTAYLWYGYWINGFRKETCRFSNQTGSDCSGIKGFTLTDPLLSNREWYLWGYDGQPNGMSDGLGTSNCIANRVNIHDGGGIDDIP